jgi:DNA-binding Lrp family transcriptional regulator
VALACGRKARVKENSLDRLDRRILNEVQRNAAQTMHEIAAKVSSTSATCHRRLKRLTEAGFITRTVAIADAARSNEPVTVVLGLVLADQARSHQNTLQDFLRNQSEIRTAWMTTGDFDYIIICAFRDVQALAHFIEKVISENESIRRYRSFIAIEDVKNETLRQF